MTTVYTATAFTCPIFCIVCSLNGSVVTCLIHVVTLAIYTAGSCLTHHFRFAITIIVINLELCVVCTGTNVFTKVNTP